MLGVAIGNRYGEWTVMGLPSENLANFEVMLVSDRVPCAVLQTHTLGDGSFRFSSVHVGEYRVAVIGLPEAYGIKTMAGGGVDLLLNPFRVVAITSTNILIETARLEEIRGGKSSVVNVGDHLLDFLKRLNRKVTIKITPHKPGEPYQVIGFAS